MHLHATAELSLHPAQLTFQPVPKPWISSARANGDLKPIENNVTISTLHAMHTLYKKLLLRYKRLAPLPTLQRSICCFLSIF